ncbi:hypothetical protein Rs2_11638 [Raphanus sativus]|nr:hypothetical protein Rs2_11638 [Raphanus sativus]
MFQTEPFHMDIKIERCKLQYGVPPRPHWVTAYYGIQDVKLILQRFGSNIIFSNGLLDPYSVGGKFTAQEIVLKSIKDIQARQYTYPEVIVGSKPPNTQPPLICGRFTCICFELAAGDILFDPHIGENYERDEIALDGRYSWD